MKILHKLLPWVFILFACAPVTPANVESLPIPTTQEYQDFAYQVVWSQDDSMVALTTNTGLYVYDTKTYKQLAAFQEAPGSTVVFSKSYLAAFGQEKVWVWKLEDFSLQFSLDADANSYFQILAISPDEKRLVTAESTQIRYWALPHGSLTATTASQNFISDMVFSKEENVILADSYFGTIQEWDTKTQKKIRSFAFSKPVVYLNLSTDGKLVVVDYGEYGFETWDVETGKVIQHYEDIIGAPGWNNLSADHQKVVVWGYGIGNESGLSVWDLSTHKKIARVFDPHHSR